jgi:hypothetical protein
VAAELLVRVRDEINTRLAELRPAVAEYERLLGLTGALTPGEQAPTAASAPASRARAPRGTARQTRGKPGRAREKPTPARGEPKPLRGATQRAIVAALEHGSHTLSELVLVTAASGSDIRAALRPLLKSQTVTTARRDGRVAYTLSSRA